MNSKTLAVFLILAAIIFARIKRGSVMSGCKNCSCNRCTGLWSKKGQAGQMGPKYIVYGTSRCGYTVKLLKEIKEMNAEDDFLYKDITDESNSEEYAQLGVQGVPVTVSIANSEKVVVGYRPFAKLIEGLNEN